MKRILIIAALSLVTTMVPAMAVERSGNDLLVDCTNLIKTESIESVSQDYVLGMGYCIGIIDGFVTFNYIYESVLQAEGKIDLLQMCLPERISTRKLATVIVKYIAEKPDQLHNSGQALAAQALVASYPCEHGN
jgi:hypothetical protein